MDKKIEICLSGQFAVYAKDGEDITPRGKKATAILALLAECETMKRARPWLQQMLWSDRGDEQARGSLRQTLFEIRQQFGSCGDALQSDRRSIWLDSSSVSVRPIENGRGFLQGIGVQDPKFRDWLRRKRLKYGSTDQSGQDATNVVRIQCGLPWTASERDPVGARILNDQVGGIISGFIAQSTRGVLETDADLIIRASLEEIAEESVVAVQVLDARRDILIHSDHSVMGNVSDLLNNSAELSRFCWKVADGALDQLAASFEKSDPAAMRAAWSQEAIGAVLTFDHSVMPRSLNILNEASGMLQDGLFYVLEAWAMMSLIMEDRLEETPDTLSAIKAALDRARLWSPADPMVTAIAANVQAILFEDYAEAFRLATLALKAQPNNIFATQAMSLCRFNLGAQDAAYQLSRQNKEVAELTKYGAMCNLHHALLCLRTNRPDEAITSSRAASEAVPQYRAPSRQLVALYAAGGQLEAASAEAERLTGIEPGFSVDRLIQDERYPANTLRTTGVLAKAKRSLDV